MILHGWRIFKSRHAASAFDGEGARLFGGRWNRKGTSMVYTSGSASLAVLEMLVHLRSHEILDAYLLAEAAFDRGLVEEFDIGRLPADWRSDPPPLALRQFGDDWAASLRSAVLKVPSAIIDGEHNYLLNPRHPDFGKIVIGLARSFAFDPRLAK